MVFRGSQETFNKLISSNQNLIEALMADTFNEGFDAASTIINELYVQADKAIDQGIPFTTIDNKTNPFITLLAKYAQKVVKEDV